MAIFVTVIRYIQKNLSTTYDLKSAGTCDGTAEMFHRLPFLHSPPFPRICNPSVLNMKTFNPTTTYSYLIV